jgi:hypothetical protein
VVGLENLDSSGLKDGREHLEVRMILSKAKKPVADDTVSFDFVALRDQKETIVQSKAGRSVVWSAKYYPAERDRYQILSYGGMEADTNAAKRKFDSASVSWGKEESQEVVGVVRPPNRDNPAWGLSVGVRQPNGQIRFSFNQGEAAKLCMLLQEDEAKSRLRKHGFPDPAAFGVREIAYLVADEKPKAKIPCGKFSKP